MILVPFEAEAEAATVCHELAFVDGDSNVFRVVDGFLRSAPTGEVAREKKKKKKREKEEGEEDEVKKMR